MADHDETEVAAAPPMRSSFRSATPSSGGTDWVEVIAAIILALATIASAWSAYQSTRWGGVMSISFSEATAARTLGTQSLAEANQLTAIDVSTFVAWAEAVAVDNELLSDFLHERFRPEFRVAVDAWIETEPLMNPEAPSTPFVMDEYQLETRDRGYELLAESEEKGVDAREANQIGDNYVLTTVLFASVLFFAGISTKFSGRKVTRGLVGLGLAAFLIGTIFIASFPIH